MRMDVTIGCQDVTIAAAGTTPLRELLRALGSSAGDPAQTWWLADRPLMPDLLLAQSGLRPGSRLSTTRSIAGRPGVLALHVVAGPAAGTVVPLERGRLDVGRDPSCDVVLPDPDVSRRHLAFELSEREIRVVDLGSTNGTRVDGAPLPAGTAAVVASGALVAAGDSLLTVAGPTEAPASVQPGDDGTVQVIRPPRQTVPMPADEIRMPGRPDGARLPRVHWLAALLPAVGAAVLAWLFGAPQFLLFALLSPVMLLGTALGERLHGRRARGREVAALRERRAHAEQRVAAGLSAEAAARRRIDPDPATVAQQVGLPGSRLWERRSGDVDLLQVRVGVGDLPAGLRTRDGPNAASAGTVRSVPVTVDLRLGPVGIAGPPAITAAVARWLIGQLAANLSPDDLELAVLVDQERSAVWQWLRWLPQLRTRVGDGRAEWSGVIAELTELVEQRAASRRATRTTWRGPWIVLLVDPAIALADIAGLAALLERGAAVGVSAICLGEAAACLPASCAAVLTTTGETGTRMALRIPAEGTSTVAVVDQVTAGWADRLARGLAPLRLGENSPSALPTSCRLLTTLGLESADATDLANRWADSEGSARALLGRDAAGPVAIDLVRDGPHALVAGTTGSGKSALLQTLVATLAANQPPDDLNVLLIDYKGGAAFGECAALPHTAGLVTDLDPYLTERALRSLRSELRRREALFARCGATDLVEYRRTGGAAVPRLVIVVDEFAALAEELPQFVHGLVGVAQRGRSLGVHLVLATQRPGRAVSPEIRANTALRVALRMTDPAESGDVIDAPDAALLDRRLPGRGYLRVGQTLTEFQTAYAGPVAEREGAAVEPLGPWRRRLPDAADRPACSDLSRLVCAVTEAAERTGRRPARRVWLSPLPTELPATALPPTGEATSLVAGLLDLPDEQRQAALTIELQPARSVLGVGSARSGRTSFLRLLAVRAAEQLPPDRLHLYVVDPAGGLSSELRRLPHAATVLGPGDAGLVGRLLDRLSAECGRRCVQRPPGDLVELLLIDGWDVVAGALSDVDALLCTERLGNLLRVGPANGLTIAVTGDRGLLGHRFASGFAQRLLFRLGDPGDYACVGIERRAVPAALPPGRILRAPDGAVAQLARPPDLDRAAARWPPAAAPRDTAVRIRPLPATVCLADLAPAAGRLLIGLAGDERQPLGIDPFHGTGRLLIAGPPRSGRSTTLRLLAVQAVAAGLPTMIAAGPRSPLRDTAAELGPRAIGPSDDLPERLPAVPTLLLVDDCEAFTDTAAGDQLLHWLRAGAAPLVAVVAARAEQLATAYRGLGVEVRRSQCGILLRPGPLDGELLGIRVPRMCSGTPPGRGLAVGEASWGADFATGEPVPVQVATP